VTAYRRNGAGALAAILALTLAGCATTVGPPPRVEGEHRLTVAVSDIDCCAVALHVALYHAESHWLTENGMVRGQVVPVLAAEQEVEFSGLPSGDYAVAAFQDLNRNGELDRLFGLIPREPYGFSGSAGGFRPPSFTEAAFAVDGGDNRIALKLRPAPF